MAMTLMIKNISRPEPSPLCETTIDRSTYRFYQSKLRQLMTQTRHRAEQEARQKQSKDNRISEQRVHREYMNYIREKAKQQSQDYSIEKSVESRKRLNNPLCNSNNTITLSVTSTTISPNLESRSRSVMKTKQTPTPVKCSQRVRNISPEIPVEETLSKKSIRSFTQATSSSLLSLDHRQARQSILTTIMLHLDSHLPSNTLKQPAYHDITQRFSSSIAPSVYRNFQRNVF